jgi:hypothetical protein
MTSLSDTLTVGLVLVLLFGSIALYLYTRIQQAEQKISLLESILLDLKMSAEVKSYTELPADQPISSSNQDYIPFSEIDDQDDITDSSDDYFPGAVIDGTGSPKKGSPAPSVSSNIEDTNDNEVNQYKSVIADAITEIKDIKVSNNYESMTLKELQTLAKTRGISGASSMKKGSIIEALKTSDRSQSNLIEPGSSGNSTFIETSSPIQNSGTIAESQ